MSFQSIAIEGDVGWVQGQLDDTRKEEHQDSKVFRRVISCEVKVIYSREDSRHL